MHIDLRTVAIEPVRNTFDHLARRFGDKPASRYQEGSYDIQPEENFHYRPTWDPDQTIFDPNLSKVRMKDWYALRDPRQFYYCTWTLTRARQQDSTESNFAFVESRGLADSLPADVRADALKLLVPLRHAGYGANLNNTFICGYGYGVAFTQPCNYHAMDNLGIAQYLSRIGLLLGGIEALNAGKKAWLEAGAWQPLRRYVEDCLVVRDPFELFVAQNFALDGLLYPLVYDTIVDTELAGRGGAVIGMLTQFMSDWHDETKKWIDFTIKTAAAESESNRDRIKAWSGAWSGRAAAAILPIAELVLGQRADAAVSEQVAELGARASKIGIGA